MDLFLAYVICFGVGLVFTLVSAFVADVFGGHDVGGHEGAGGHAEAGFGADDMPGFAALSPTTIASFITAFGGIGMVLSKFEATKITQGRSAEQPASEADILDAEKLLIFAHTPARNSHSVLRLPEERFQHIHVLNWGNHGSLMPEVSGSRWSERFNQIDITKCA